MPHKNLSNVLAEEIGELYTAEKQLTKAILQMATKAFDPALKDMFSTYLKATQVQMTRLERARNLLGIKGASGRGFDVKDVLKETVKPPRAKDESGIPDLELIGAETYIAQEAIAAYMTAIVLAEQVEAGEVADLLKQSLSEKLSAEERLHHIGSRLVRAAESTSWHTRNRLH